jgi:hypothetical protein
MFLSRGQWPIVWAVGMMAACTGAILRAGDPGTEEALAKFGLKRAGMVLVLETEAEVHSKARETRRLAGELSYALMKQRGMLSEKEYQQTLKELHSEINQFRAELNTTNQQMAQIPRFRGRMVNSIAAEQFGELMVYRNQLLAEINQRTSFLNQLKSQSFDPKARLAIDTEVRNRHEALHQSVVDLRRLVDAVNEKYAGLAKDPVVKKAVETLGRSTGPQYKLGPSREFLSNVKLLEKLEKEGSPDEAGDSAAQPARKARRLTKGKRSSKTAAGPAGSDSPF